jgi:hypothetical protein
LVSRNLGGSDSFLHGFTESTHVIGVALRSVIGVFLLAMERILSDASAKTAFAGIYNGDANAERPEIYSGYDGHKNPFLTHLLREELSSSALYGF